MTTKTIAAIVIALVVAGGVLGGYRYLLSKPQPQLAATTPQGGTTSSALFYSVAANLGAPGANATSSTVFNNSYGINGSDLYITSVTAGCENVGTSQTAYTGAPLSALTLSVATSSTAAPATNGNTNLVGGGTITIGTSTTQYTIASTTATIGSPKVYNLWASGSALDFTTNATNTAQCTFGVNAFSS